MEPTEWFAGLVARDDDDVPLDEAALLFAAHAYPELDVEAWLGRIDELAARAAAHRSPDGIAELLFVEAGISGNTVDYTDPRNSFLNDVIERRLGIPISMSVLLVEVGRRLGVRLHGVGLPGHFLVGIAGDPQGFLDPFHQGRHLDAEGCRSLFHELHGAGAAFDAGWLAPVGATVILRRMLANLEHAYLSRGRGGVAWVARLGLCFPDTSTAERMRLARVLAAAGSFSEAATAFEVALPELDGSEARAVEVNVRALRARSN